jgi:hypothetical protein
MREGLQRKARRICMGKSEDLERKARFFCGLPAKKRAQKAVQVGRRRSPVLVKQNGLPPMHPGYGPCHKIQFLAKRRHLGACPGGLHFRVCTRGAAPFSTKTGRLKMAYFEM